MLTTDGIRNPHTNDHETLLFKTIRLPIIAAE